MKFGDGKFVNTAITVALFVGMMNDVAMVPGLAKAVHQHTPEGTAVEVLSPHAVALAAAALVPRWRFTPAKKGGQPVPTWMTYGGELAVSLEKAVFTAFTLEPIRKDDPLVATVPDTTGDASSVAVTPPQPMTYPSEGLTSFSTSTFVHRTDFSSKTKRDPKHGHRQRRTSSFMPYQMPTGRSMANALPDSTSHGWTWPTTTNGGNVWCSTNGDAADERN